MEEILNKMKNTTFFICLFMFNCSFSQQTEGSIIMESGEAIPFANIQLKNTTIGTVSNEEGKFSIYVPTKHQNEAIVFSFLGFETQELTVAAWNKKKQLQIILKQKIELLEETLVIGKRNKLTGDEILAKAFDNYNLNFSDKPFIAKGFIRHTERDKKEYKYLVEAAIEKYDAGYTTDVKNQKTNVLEVRKSFDNRVFDSLFIYQLYQSDITGKSLYKISKKFSTLKNIQKEEINKAILNKDNYRWSNKVKQTFFYDLFRKDLLRYHNVKGATFDKKMFKRMTFNLDSTLFMDDEVVYRIKITPNSKPYKEYGKTFFPIGWIYIQKSDFSILEFELSFLRSKSDDYANIVLGSRVTLSLNVKYKRINGHMYLYYLKIKKPKVLNLRRLIESKEARTKPESFYFTTEEILFTEFIFDPEIIQSKNNEVWQEKLFGKQHPYNYTFWKNYNTLLETKEQEKLINDLEKKVSLKEQFKNNN